MLKSDSLNKRYLYKLSSNLIGFLLGLVSAGIVPRALGVNNYGNFNYATTILTQIISFFDFRTSTCFFTKLSQRQKENDLLIFYLYYTIIVFILLTITIVIIKLTGLDDILFTGIGTMIIYYGLVYVIINWALDLLVRVMDAVGETVKLEKMRVINKVITTLCVIILFLLNSLNIVTYFYFLFFVALIMIIPMVIYLRKKEGYSFRIFPFLPKEKINSYMKEFWVYSGPLGLYVLLTFIGVSFERWVLQVHGGSFQQGLYSFSFTLTNFCFLFTSALIPLFTREMSIAAEKKNIKEMAGLFRKYVPLLYAITAYFCCFIFVEINNMISLFGGREYLNAKAALSLLAFYPLVSTYSNLNGSVIYATSRTRIFPKLAAISIPFGMLLSFILISNNNIVGLNLGAQGLAIKNLLLEIIVVLIILSFNCRIMNIKFWKYAAHMFFSILPFLAAAFISHYIVGLMAEKSAFFEKPLHSLFLSGLIYSFFSFLIVVLFPIIIGLHKADLYSFKDKILKFFN